jgi:hypothetical protein
MTVYWFSALAWVRNQLALRLDRRILAPLVKRAMEQHPDAFQRFENHTLFGPQLPGRISPQMTPMRTQGLPVVVSVILLYVVPVICLVVYIAALSLLP